MVAQTVHDPDEGPFDPADASGRSYVYNVDESDMPSALVEALGSMASNYKPTFSRTLGATVWGNQCTHCGALQGAFFLHSEPDGPFFEDPDQCSSGSEQILSTGNFTVNDAGYSV